MIKQLNKIVKRINQGINKTVIKIQDKNHQ